MSDSSNANPVFVLDASALVAFLWQEPGEKVVAELLAEPDNVCLVHAINLCEVYYDFLRRTDKETAQQATSDLIAAGIEVQETVGASLWQQVGELKVYPGRLSLADCFALALAIQNGATLVTADHHEFDRILPLGLSPILFIR